LSTVGLTGSRQTPEKYEFMLIVQFSFFAATKTLLPLQLKIIKFLMD
jgi:hypothetical protein